MIYDIVSELEDRRAIIKGEYKDLYVDDDVVIRDGRGTLYDARIITRCDGGTVIVKVLDVI